MTLKYEVHAEIDAESVHGFTGVGLGPNPEEALAYFAYRDDAEAMVKMANEYVGLKIRIAELEESI